MRVTKVTIEKENSLGITETLTLYSQRDEDQDPTHVKEYSYKVNPVTKTVSVFRNTENENNRWSDDSIIPTVYLNYNKLGDSIEVDYTGSVNKDSSVISALNEFLENYYLELKSTSSPAGFPDETMFFSVCGNITTDFIQNPIPDEFVNLLYTDTLTINNYISAYRKFSSNQFTGTMISDLISPIGNIPSESEQESSGDILTNKAIDYLTSSVNPKTGLAKALKHPSSTQRSTLQNVLWKVAASRKDLTCVFTVPDNMTATKAASWVDNNIVGVYSPTIRVDYSEQSFYCEEYWAWCWWNFSYTDSNDTTQTAKISVPVTPWVMLNSITSFRSRGQWFPVAGDQYGILPSDLSIKDNPSQDVRDFLITHRINPIFDTGTRGIQIYGNETLNPVYSDLSSAHIARTMVYIRSTVDEFSEKCKFMLNDLTMWTYWINTVSDKVLEPIKVGRGLQYYLVLMGNNTTTKEEIANRKINGQIQLQFTQDAEIFTLEYQVISSALTME